MGISAISASLRLVRPFYNVGLGLSLFCGHTAQFQAYILIHKFAPNLCRYEGPAIMSLAF